MNFPAARRLQLADRFTQPVLSPQDHALVALLPQVQCNSWESGTYAKAQGFAFLFTDHGIIMVICGTIFLMLLQISVDPSNDSSFKNSWIRLGTILSLLAGSCTVSFCTIGL